jgi:DNA-binding HxlR family transcriptional regulator
MNTVIESSTLQANRDPGFKEYPVTFVIERIGGHWKPLILLSLLSGSKQYHELRSAIPCITEKLLLQHLIQLEADNLIVRDAVTYSLTASGLALKSVLHAMAEWEIEDSSYKTYR